MVKALKDPVAGEDKKGAITNIEDLAFKPVRPEAARTVRPFDGYPLKKVKIDGKDVISTYIVALNPTVQVRQDPSNKKVKTKQGLVQVNTTHSRFIRDYEEQENNIVSFDRTITIKGQDYFYDVVPSHNVRAQLFFKFDNEKQRIVVDPNYMLLDSDQESRLKRVFEQIMNPALKVEREASFISGESQSDAGETDPLKEDEV
jgi:hypothetical protein